MKKLLSIFIFLSVFVLTTFFLFADFEVYVESQLGQATSLRTFSAFSFIFLLSDIVFPIPSSLIMILNGKILGFAGGFFLSSFAGVCSSTIGFYLGRKSEKYLSRFFNQTEIESANRFYEKYGKISVALSRAIPVLSETIAVLSGTTNMRFSIFLLYSLAGHFVVSAFYAFVGAGFAQWNGHVITVLVVVATLLLSWILSVFINKQNTVRLPRRD